MVGLTGDLDAGTIFWGHGLPGVDSAQARSVCRSLTDDRVRGCPRMRTSFVRRPGGAADIGLHRCTPLRSEVFGRGDQRQEPLWGRGQPTPPPNVLYP